jgi:hypothetical protein
VAVVTAERSLYGQTPNSKFFLYVFLKPVLKNRRLYIGLEKMYLALRKLRKSFARSLKTFSPRKGKMKIKSVLQTVKQADNHIRELKSRKWRRKIWNTARKAAITESLRLKHLFITTVESHEDNERSNREATAYHNGA